MNVRHTFVRLAVVLTAVSMLASSVAAQEIPSHEARFAQLAEKKNPLLGAYVVKEINGKTLCLDATPEEAVRINRAPDVPLKVFGEDRSRVRTNASAGLDIILLGTAQLDANPQAKAAFEKAAEIWESRIANPVTVYVKVDFGTTRFGQPFDENVIASASSDLRGPVDAYSQIRTKLIARADNATETTLYNSLPGSSLPTDLGSTTSIASPSILLRTLGLLPATAQQSDPGPEIGFNSAFPYDFDPSNGISPGTKDFEGVVVHEVGHMLGFSSLVGAVEAGIVDTPVPTILDFFRFRPGVTGGTFNSAQRIQSSGGDQVYYGGGSTLAMSTGRPDGSGGDGQQASHWKDDDIAGVRIGIMDPTLSSGFRTELTNNDILAFGVLGFNMVTPNTGGAPAAPSGLAAAGTSTSVIRLTWTDNSNNETEFRVEQKSGASFVDIGSAAANATAINVTNFQPNSTATFRIRARNGSGDSPYSNEATGTTFGSPGAGCTPSSTVVCLLSNRFRVKIDYVNPFSNPPNQPGTFLAARLSSGVANPDTALFGFSSAQAVEVLVRLQDTRPFANRFDVYYGGMTDVGYTVTVTDTVTGNTRQYVNQVGKVGGGVDRSSFPASILGVPDRLITSGGTDSFPAEPLAARQPGDLVAFDDSARVRKVPAQLLENAPARLATQLEKSTARTLSATTNAGGGGACTEAEPNDTVLLSDDLTLGQPCSGFAQVTDSGSYTIQYSNAPDGKIHDVYNFTTGASGPVTVTLNFTNASADLDVFLFSVSGSTLNIIDASTGSSTTETFTTSTLSAGTYYVGVSAYSGGSAYTVLVNGSGAATPAAPSNLAAAGTSTSVIRLTWNDNSNNETEFRVEQKSGASFVDIGKADANATAINVTNFQPNSTATFRIRARNGSGDSPYSNEATGTTFSAPGSGCTPSSTVVCLLSNRFRVKIDYINPFSNPPNQPGTFLAARLLQGTQNPDVGLFGFDSAQAVEVVVRVQDTRPFANRFDIYYGGLTDVGYTVSVTDTQTGASRTYTNTVGTVGGGVDRTSFPAN